MAYAYSSAYGIGDNNVYVYMIWYRYTTIRSLCVWDHAKEKDRMDGKQVG